MPLEKFVTDAMTSATRVAEKFVKDTWNKLDAAAEKPRPSEYLSHLGIKAIQGVKDIGRPDQ